MKIRFWKNNPQALKAEDLAWIEYRLGRNNPVTVKVTHLPTGNQTIAEHKSLLQAREQAIRELTRKVFD